MVYFIKRIISGVIYNKCFWWYVQVAWDFDLSRGTQNKKAI